MRQRRAPTPLAEEVRPTRATTSTGKKRMMATVSACRTEEPESAADGAAAEESPSDPAAAAPSRQPPAQALVTVERLVMGYFFRHAVVCLICCRVMGRNPRIK